MASWGERTRGPGQCGAVEGTLFCRAQSIDRKDVIDQPRFHLRRRGNLENQSQRPPARTPRRNIPRRGEKGPRAGGRARRSRAESGSLARGVGSCQHLGPVLCAEQGRMSVCLKKKKKEFKGRLRKPVCGKFQPSLQKKRGSMRLGGHGGAGNRGGPGFPCQTGRSGSRGIESRWLGW